MVAKVFLEQQLHPVQTVNAEQLSMVQHVTLLGHLVVAVPNTGMRSSCNALFILSIANSVSRQVLWIYLCPLPYYEWLPTRLYEHIACNGNRRAQTFTHRKGDH